MIYTDDVMYAWTADLILYLVGGLVNDVAARCNE